MTPSYGGLDIKPCGGSHGALPACFPPLLVIASILELQSLQPYFSNTRLQSLHPSDIDRRQASLQESSKPSASDWASEVSRLIGKASYQVIASPVSGQTATGRRIEIELMRCSIHRHAAAFPVILPSFQRAELGLRRVPLQRIFIIEGLGRASREHLLSNKQTNKQTTKLKQVLTLNLHRGMGGGLLSPRDPRLSSSRDISLPRSLPDGLCCHQNTSCDDRSVCILNNK